MGEYAIDLPESLVEAVAEQVAARIAAKMPEPSEPYMDADAAAEYISANRKRIYELMSSGKIPCYQDGRRKLCRRSDLDAYLAG